MHWEVADAMTTFCLHARDLLDTCHHHLRLHMTRFLAIMMMPVPSISIAVLK